MIPRAVPSLVTVALIGLVHLAVGCSGAVSVETDAVLFAANVYVAYCGWLVARSGRRAGLLGFAAGYLVLFLLTAVLLRSESLFLLLAVAYASVYRLPLLLGLFGIFVLAYVVLQPYAAESFLVLAPIFLAVHGLGRQGVRGFPRTCLWLGLLALGLVLFPFVHLVLQDAPQTLSFVGAREDVRRAILLSFATAGVATLVVGAFGVPLAYALARTGFPGRQAVEALVDLPILIPQSVVGIALLVLLGHGSPLGRALEAAGLGVSGRFAGIVIAQVVVACPFLVKTALTAFEGVPARLEDASAMLGAGPFVTFRAVTLPLASRGVLTGVLLAWGRAVSEFGAVLLVAPRPLTAPVLIHEEFVQSGAPEARPIAAVFLLSCLFAFALAQIGRRGLPSSRPSAGRPTAQRGTP